MTREEKDWEIGILRGIERGIQIFLQSGEDTITLSADVETAKMLAAALRDMLKRREGCDFCNESEQIQNPYGDIMEMDDGVLILDTEGYPRVTFRIKYCPDCGRELSGNAEQVKEGGK